jgi:hypothetical protein
LSLNPGGSEWICFWRRTSCFLRMRE